MKENNKNQKSTKFVITEKGSLGLLAYGDIGLREWRKVKLQNSKEGSNEKA